MFLLLFGGTSLHLTIDRIEGNIAVVEWDCGFFSELPHKLLPPASQEGSQLQLNLTSWPRASAILLSENPAILLTNGGLIALPLSDELESGQHYIFTFQRRKRTDVLPKAKNTAMAGS